MKLVIDFDYDPVYTHLDIEDDDDELVLSVQIADYLLDELVDDAVEFVGDAILEELGLRVDHGHFVGDIPPEPGRPP